MLWRLKKNKKPSAAKYQGASKSKPPKNRVYSMLLFFLMSAVFLVAYFLWSYLSSSNTLLFKHIKLVASAHYVSPKLLQKIVHDDLKGGFFSMDTKVLRDDMLALPWVSSVAIRKIWPTSLLINVKEQVPIAQWNNRAVINDMGNLFYPARNTIPESLPKLAGPIGTEEQVLDMFRVLNTDVAVIGLKLNQLILSDRPFVVFAVEQWYAGRARTR